MTFILPGQRHFFHSSESLRRVFCVLPSDADVVSLSGASGALSDVQNKVPSEAFGEPAVTPTGPVATESSPATAAATATA